MDYGEGKETKRRYKHVCIYYILVYIIIQCVLVLLLATNTMTACTVNSEVANYK